MSEVYMRELQKLNLEDKFLFNETMEDETVYADTVSILLERELEFLNPSQTEKELRISTQLRQIRLDVLNVEKDGSVYYTEMQKKNTYNLVKRSRYYQSQMDVSLLEPGETDFNRLNDACLILVAPFDIFGKGLYRYTFEGVCRECPDLKLNDGSTRIFINTKGTNSEEFSQEFLDFMEYITDTSDAVAESTESVRIKRIHKKVTAIRKSEKAGVKLMQKWEELAYARQEGEVAGYERGETAGYKTGYEKSKLQIARKLKAEGIPEELICRVAEISLEELQNSEDVAPT